MLELETRQKDMEQTANKLVTSLSTAVEKLGDSHTKQESMMSLHTEAIKELHAQNVIIAKQSEQMEKTLRITSS